MRFKNYIEEMAMPRLKDIAKIYYHGTDNDKFAKSILSKGIQPPDLSIGKKSMLTPVEGKVYITPNLEYALIYAIGGNMIGSELPEFFYKRGKYAWLFAIDGKELKDIQPDEDSVGEMIYYLMTGSELAGETFNKKEWKRPNWLLSLARRKLTHRQLSKVADGEYSYWALAGKKLLKIMSDKQKLELIDSGAHIAHTGPIKPKEAWRMPKEKNEALNKDGSNFFQIAERVK